MCAHFSYENEIRGEILYEELAYRRKLYVTEQKKRGFAGDCGGIAI
jgi:hypothetical protein